MSQTFAQWKARLAARVQRDDLAASYGGYFNTALRKIQDRRSWLAMKKTVNVAVPTGTGRETVALPADFKELQKRPAVHYITDEGQFIPAEVVTEEQQIYRVWAFGGTPICTWPPRVFFERTATGAILGVLEPLSQPFNFRVKYYGYLPDLALDSSTSPIADAYPELVFSKAKSVAFADINDPIAAVFEQQFEKELADAIRVEAYSEVRGMDTRL